MLGTRTFSAPLLASLTLLMCAFSGCQFDSPPTVAVTGARWFAVSDSEPKHVQLMIDLELENLEEESIQLEVFEYTFKTTASDGQKESWTGLWLPLRTIPADTKILMTIPAVIPMPDSLIDWEIRGDLSYKAPGRWAQILFDTGLRTPSTGFRGTGQTSNPEDN